MGGVRTQGDLFGGGEEVGGMGRGGRGWCGAATGMNTGEGRMIGSMGWAVVEGPGMGAARCGLGHEWPRC